MKNLHRSASVLIALSLASFAFAGDKKAENKGSCCKQETTSCCPASKAEKSDACCKAEKPAKQDEKKPAGQ